MQISHIFLPATFLFYILCGRLVMRWMSGALREVVMAFLNVAGVIALFFYDPFHPYHIANVFVLYFLIVVFQYVLFRLFSETKGWSCWLAFFAPIVSLIAIRYIPNHVVVALARSLGKKIGDHSNMVGLSYLAFRCSRLVLEVRNGSASNPGFFRYLSFAFFMPTLSVGPISTYASFQRGYGATPWRAPFVPASMRVLVGLVKYLILSGVLSQVSYSAFLLDGAKHSWIALPVVMVLYYLYLYCNFSGYCDIAVGTAALIGIPVQENFNNPFAARNIKEFWNRWHITLSSWMRDIVFAPLSKKLVGLMGVGNANHAIALAIFVVFLLVGVWHGAGWNFLIYGASHAIGLVANHYYTIGLKKWLGRDGFKAYMENRWIHAAAVALTFGYCAASLMFFANTLPQIKEIIRVLC